MYQFNDLIEDINRIYDLYSDYPDICRSHVESCINIYIENVVKSRIKKNTK